MAYQSIYAGRSTATVPNSSKANPFAADFKPGQYLAKNQPKSQQPAQPKVAPPPKPKTLLNKIGSVAKTAGNAAVAGERKVATGIARDLPGGTADLEANVKQSEQASKNLALAKQIKSSKLINESADTASQAGKTNRQTIKAMPSKKQIALGAASTAADIVTAGTLPAIKGASLTAKIARAGTQAGAFGTAGALNSASSGGSKKQIAENFVAGAAFPGVLHIAGKGVNKAIEKTGLPATKELVTNTKTKTILDASQPVRTVAADVHTAKSINSIMSKVKPTRGTVERAQAEQEAHAAGAKAAEDTAKQTQKTVETNQKLDNQIELVKAKQADGKFTNVDKVKVKQLEAQKVPVEAPTKAPVANTEPVLANTSPANAAPTGGSLLSKTTEGSIPKTTEANAIKLQPEPKVSARKQTAFNPNKPEPVSVPIKEAPAERSTQETRTAGSALNSETRAVQKGLVKEFEGKAEYGAGSYKDEAAAAVKLVKENPEEARAIALGQKPGDNTIHEVAVAKALENKALKEGDVDTLLKLSSSPRHSVTSEAAQRLGAEGFQGENSAVKNLAAVRKVRQDAVEKKLGKPITKAVSDEVKQIKVAKPKIPKETFQSFVESLKC